MEEFSDIMKDTGMPLINACQLDKDRHSDCVREYLAKAKKNKEWMHPVLKVSLTSPLDDPPRLDTLEKELKSIKASNANGDIRDLEDVDEKSELLINKSS